MNSPLDRFNLARRLDRRQKELGPPAALAERRIHPERRGILEKPLSLRQWADDVANYYYHAGTHLVEYRRWPERRIIDKGGPPRGQERRLTPERRAIGVQPIPLEKWAEEMANYYFHFHPGRR